MSKRNDIIEDFSNLTLQPNNTTTTTNNNNNYNSNNNNKGNREKESYGIVFWLNIDGSWYFLSQISFSSYECDVKSEPFRGRPKNNEKKYDTAARRCFDESYQLIDIRPYDHNNEENFIGNLFHFRLAFANPNDLQTLFMGDFVNNNKLLGFHENIFSINIERIQEENNPRIRRSENIRNMLGKKVTFDTLPLITLARQTPSNGRGIVTYKPAAVQVAQPTAAAIPWVDAEVGPNNSYFRPQAISNEQILDWNIEAILAKLHDYPFPRDKNEIITALKGKRQYIMDLRQRIIQRSANWLELRNLLKQ